jgi:cytochrome c biogenesis protein CcmG, thiol:disulfide interchange protein DsbE
LVDTPDGEPVRVSDVSFEMFDGRTASLADYAGRPVVVNFWASWCPPCVEEFPVLMQAQRQLGPDGLQVVGVNSQDNEREARDFLADMDAEGLFPHVNDPRGERAVEWGVFGLPETFLIDRDGIVRAKAVGLLTEEWIIDEVLPVLEEA